MLWFAPLSALILGYFLGSIPFGLVLTRFAGAGDLRAIGSGNIGATNVLRTGRKGLAGATLFLDGAKGAAAVLIAEAIQPGLGAMAGMAAFLGHCYPVWLRFRRTGSVPSVIRAERPFKIVAQAPFAGQSSNGFSQVSTMWVLTRRPEPGFTWR